MARNSESNTTPDPASVLPIAPRTGFLRSILEQLGRPQAEPDKRAPLARIGRGAERASLYAILLLAIQIGLNIYGIPTPINLSLAQFQTVEQAEELTPPEVELGTPVELTRPAISKATRTTPTPTDNSITPLPTIATSVGQADGPDMSQSVQVKPQKRRRPAARVSDAWDALRGIQKPR